MNYRLILNCDVLIYIISFIQIYKINSEFSLKYPFSLYLPNGNIFVINEMGITIYDHLFSTKVEEVINFPEEEKLRINDIPRITTVFEDEYLFCIIKDKIFIFNDKGNLLFNNNTSILEKNVEPKYYSLVVFKIEEFLFKYYINYKFNKYLYEFYFQFNITSNENILFYYTMNSYFRHYHYNGFSTYNLFYDYGYNNSFTSQYMIDKENNHFKVNIFFYEDKITFGIFLKKGSDERFSHSPPLTTNYKDVECIKSIINSNRSKTLVSLYSLSGELKSFIYDINTDSVLKLKQNFIEFFCKHHYFGLNLYYFKYKENFINSCLDTDGNILIEFYDKDFNLYDYDIISNNNRISFGYSILYSNCTQKYFYISQEIPFKLLYGDNIQLDNIKKDFNIENCFIIEEKEIEIEINEETETNEEIEEEKTEIEENEISEKESEVNEEEETETKEISEIEEEIKEDIEKETKEEKEENLKEEEEIKEEENETKETSEIEEELEISDIPENSKDNSNSTMFIIIIIFVCLIFLAIIGYWIYRKYIKRPNANEMLDQIIDEADNDLPEPIN